MDRENKRVRSIFVNADKDRSRDRRVADRYGLLAAIFDETLTEDDKRSIDRLLRSVCRGRIKLVDELSAIR
ncbi:MAG: hypothetical protein EAZ10_01360 [Oscillatoriales cyanobacterium]|nr:MAG: hypothetical protein EAZ10_01360 [Oscillatoriales cyanobacterium]